MQKYLLLLLMCLVGMIEAQAGIKVENVGTGSYILTFTSGTTANDWNALTSIKSATSVKIVTDGYKLSTNDMKKITGEQEGATPFFSKLETLDLADAELTSYDDLQYFAFDNLKKLETFAFPKKTTSIPLLYNDRGMFQNNTHIKKVLMYEDDDTDLSSFKRIADKTFMGASNLSTVRIPEGVEEIGKNAFGGDLQHPAPPLETVLLPNTLKRIEENAFAYNRALKTITIPHSVNFIGNSAFQWNTSMTDVYVLGNYVKIADGAFNQEETYNFEYKQNGDVDFADWKPTTQGGQAGTTHPLLLHVPDNDTSYGNYINPFLRMLNDPAFDDPNGNNALLNAVENIAEHSSEKSQIDAIARKYGVSTPLADYGILKRSNWVTMKSPADDRLKRFFKKANGLFNKGNEVHNSEYGGWRNFMLVACDVEKKTWHDGRLIESRWYSAVFPFSMSYNQLMSTYGVGTDVREFSYVNQHDNGNGEAIRTVTFLKEPAMPEQGRNAEGYVVRGRPYMIHPGVRSVPVEPKTQPSSAPSTAAKAPVHRTIAGVDVDAANDEIESGEHLETVIGDLVNGNLRGPKPQPIDEKAYTFKGTYKDTDVPAYTFFLGIKNGDLSTLGFYVTRVELKGKWKEFTAVVRKTDDSSNSYAKSMDLGFTDIIEDDFGITTAVENAAVNESSKNSGVVYNLSGQAVRENNASLEGLSKGVYVVNGKKIVVR